MHMDKNLAATCTKLIKWERSCQISYQLLDLFHLTNTKFVFLQMWERKREEYIFPFSTVFLS